MTVQKTEVKTAMKTLAEILSNNDELLSFQQIVKKWAYKRVWIHLSRQGRLSSFNLSDVDDVAQDMILAMLECPNCVRLIARKQKPVDQKLIDYCNRQITDAVLDRQAKKAEEYQALKDELADTAIKMTIIVSRELHLKMQNICRKHFGEHRYTDPETGEQKMIVYTNDYSLVDLVKMYNENGYNDIELHEYIHQVLARHVNSDKLEIVTKLVVRGYSLAEIAKITKLSDYQVDRYIRQSASILGDYKTYSLKI